MAVTLVKGLSSKSTSSPLYSQCSLNTLSAVCQGETHYICDRLWENRAQRGMRRRRKKIDLVLKIVLNKPNEGNG